MILKEFLKNMEFSFSEEIVPGKLFFKTIYHESTQLSGPIKKLFIKTFYQNNYQESDRLAE